MNTEYPPYLSPFALSVDRGLVGPADGLSGAVYNSELHGPCRSGSVGVRGGICGGVVRGCTCHAERTASGWDNVSYYRCIYLVFVGGGEGGC